MFNDSITSRELNYLLGQCKANGEFVNLSSNDAFYGLGNKRYVPLFNYDTITVNDGILVADSVVVEVADNDAVVNVTGSNNLISVNVYLDLVELVDSDENVGGVCLVCVDENQNLLSDIGIEVYFKEQSTDTYELIDTFDSNNKGKLTYTLGEYGYYKFKHETRSVEYVFSE